MKKIIGKTLVIAVFGLLVVGSIIYTIMTKNDTQKMIKDKKDVKNVILLISDGCGYNQIMATDYYIDGKAGTQIYEEFPTKLAMCTYSIDGSYDPITVSNNFDYIKFDATDSAAAATAMSTGYKTHNGSIGVDVNIDDLDDLKNIIEYFEDSGRATGVVSSVEFCHATPAGFVAHNASRNNYSDIANEMITQSTVDVIMGAGHPYYDNNGEPMAANFKYVGGQAIWDGLVDGSLSVADANGDGKSDAWTLVETKEEFEALSKGKTPERVIGIPQVYQTLQQSREGDDKADAYEVEFNKNVPSLATMTNAALNVLDNDEDGFFLMVEGGAVDWAGSLNQSGRLIQEQEEFNVAVEAVCLWVEENSNWNETLVIVTGDHETGYLTGRIGENDEVGNNGAGVMPTMAWNSREHTNQLIPFYAKGCGAGVFKEFADQNDPVRGGYINNTEMMDVILSLID